jgi:hypothetical protein
MAQDPRRCTSEQYLRRMLEESEETIRRSRQLLADSEPFVRAPYPGPVKERPEQAKAALRGISPRHHWPTGSFSGFQTDPPP